MHTLEAFLSAAQSSLDVFSAWARQAQPNGKADHLGYKCSSSQEFEELRAILEHQSTFVYQSIISQRRIAIIKFVQPLSTALGDIWYLELSDQKPDGSQKSGFDHLELYPVERSVDQLVAELEQKGLIFEKTVRPHHTTFDLIISEGFKVRLEAEPLIEKIMREEMQK